MEREVQGMEREVQGMEIMVEYLRFFEEYGFEDYDVIEFKTVKEAYTFYNNTISADKRLWIGDYIFLQHRM